MLRLVLKLDASVGVDGGGDEDGGWIEWFDCRFRILFFIDN